MFCMEQRIVIHVVHSSPRMRAQLSRTIFDLGHHAEVYADIGELAEHLPRTGMILAADGGEDGEHEIVALIEAMNLRGVWLPVIAMAAEPALERVVSAIRAGALDYLAQPLVPEAFAAAIGRVSRAAENHSEQRRRAAQARLRISMLSNREREVLDRLAEGFSNKAIARELDISPRTVEIHRGNMMDKLGARHAAQAVRLALEASMGDWLH